MAKVVEAYTGQARSPERWHVPALAHVADAERGAGSRREHEDAAAPRYDESVPMLAEDRDHRGVDGYRSGAVALRGADSAAFQRAFDAERLRLPRDVSPLEGERFADSKPASDENLGHRSVARPARFEVAPGLLAAERAHHGAFVRQLERLISIGAVRRVARDDSFAHRPSEDLAQRNEAVVNALSAEIVTAIQRCEIRLDSGARDRSKLQIAEGREEAEVECGARSPRRWTARAAAASPPANEPRSYRIVLGWLI
jgi:hypothetical protein